MLNKCQKVIFSFKNPILFFTLKPTKFLQFHIFFLRGNKGLLVKVFSLVILVAFLLSSNTNAQIIPNSLISFNEPNSHAILIDKTHKELKVYKYEKNWSLVKTYKCTTGKRAGDKKREGDLKTPRGVYFPTKFYNTKYLAEIYGVGALALSYPNQLDKVQDKSGTGIWIHGTDKESPEPTRGCVSVSNEDWLEISKYIKVGETPVIIEKTIDYSSEETVQKTERQIGTFLENWRSSWEKKDLGNFFANYSSEFAVKGQHIVAWKKKHQLARMMHKKVSIKIDKSKVLEADDIFYVVVEATYNSSLVNFMAEIELFLEKDQKGNFKILTENFLSKKSIPKLALSQKAKTLHASFTR